MPPANRSIFLTLLGLLTIAAPAASGRELVLQLSDQHGTALAQAVVTISAPASSTPPAPASVVHLLDQVEKRFVPDVLAIRKGDSVRFPNSDDIRHHVYSFSVPKTFELPLYSGEPENPVRFLEAGLVVVGCNIHDRMQAHIYIIDAAHFALSGSDGKVQFSGLPADAVQVTVQHPLAAQDPALQFTLDAGAATTQELRIEMQAVSAPDTAGMSELQRKFQSLRHDGHQGQ